MNYTPTYTQFFAPRTVPLQTVQEIVMIQIQYSRMLFPDRPNTPEKNIYRKTGHTVQF